MFTQERKMELREKDRWFLEFTYAVDYNSIISATTSKEHNINYHATECIYDRKHT